MDKPRLVLMDGELLIRVEIGRLFCGGWGSIGVRLILRGLHDSLNECGKIKWMSMLLLVVSEYIFDCEVISPSHCPTNPK